MCVCLPRQILQTTLHALSMLLAKDRVESIRVLVLFVHGLATNLVLVFNVVNAGPIVLLLDLLHLFLLLLISQLHIFVELLLQNVQILHFSCELGSQD